MEAPRSVPAWAPAEERGRSIQEGRGSDAGLVAALTACFSLWRCRRVGARARAVGRPFVPNPANVEIGDDVLIDSHGARAQLVAIGRGRIVVGNAVRIGPGTRIAASRYVEIGDGTRIGAGCVVSDADGAPGAEAEIWIGDGVTLGEGVRVLPGAVIGAGAVVPDGAVVEGRVAPAAAAGAGGAAPGA